MAKTELGLKRTCLSCGARFYDLNNKEIVCPKCEAAFDPDAAVKLRRNRNVPADVKKVVKKEVDVDATVDDIDDVLESTDDEDVLEDTSDLDDDDVVVAIPAKENSDDL